MKKALVVVDMQRDFIDGALGTKEAEAIVPGVVAKIKGFDAVSYTHLGKRQNTYGGQPAGIMR